MSTPMMKVEWLRVDESTEGMNVPGGCVFRCWSDENKNATLVYVPMVAIVMIDGIAYLTSTLPAVMGEMMSKAGEVTEKMIKDIERKHG
jgi:hypothetical protein